MADNREEVLVNIGHVQHSMLLSPEDKARYTRAGLVGDLLDPLTGKPYLKTKAARPSSADAK